MNCGQLKASPWAHLFDRHSARRVHVAATLSGMPYEQTQHPIIAQNVHSFNSWHYTVRAQLQRKLVCHREVYQTGAAVCVVFLIRVVLREDQRAALVGSH